ncbi:aquaporin-like protein [Paraphysoderma sedebokerense]|nr:aquaporin-like protein [Paraphysoderma sedebokerense]
MVLKGLEQLTKVSLFEDFVAAIGEFVGTTFFIFLALGGVDAALRINNGTLDGVGVLIVAFSFGFSLLALVWAFYRITGGVFNPAITLGLLFTLNITLFRAFLYMIAQIAGGILGALFANIIFPNHSTYPGVNKLANGISSVQGLFLEALLTTVLVFVVFMLAVEKNRATFLAPVAIGFTVFLLHIVGTPWTGTSVNPARSFGPSVISGKFPNHWIFWVGPFMGSVFASLIYGLFKVLKYERLNPNQDVAEMMPTIPKNLVDMERADSGLAR